VVIPEYGIEKKLVPGDNTIEFTPTNSGVIAYSCWMGMIRSTITMLEADG
jgi:plastocyanin domain-containing protein